MKLTSLLALIAQQHGSKAIIKALEADSSQYSISAPEGYFPALLALIAQHREEVKAPLVVVCASSKKALELREELSQYLSGVELFVPWETLPHEKLSPRADTMASRVSLLRRLTHPVEGSDLAGEVKVVVASIRSLLQPVWAQLPDIEPLAIKIGDYVSLEEASSRLSDLGYERVDIVSTRGEYALRGGIIDVFPGHLDHPLRIELFGDEIEDIRFFSVSDQRALAQAPHGLWAPACRELLLNDQVRARAASLVNRLPGVRQMLELASEGIYSEGLESLSSVLLEPMVCPLELLAPGTHIVSVEPELLTARAQDLVDTTKEFLAAAWQAAAEGGQSPIDAARGEFFTMQQCLDKAKEKSFPWWNLGSLPLDDDLVIEEASEVFFPPAGAFDKLGELKEKNWTVVLCGPGSGRAKRLVELCLENNIPASLVTQITVPSPQAVQVVSSRASYSFMLEEAKFAFISDEVLLGRRRVTQTMREGLKAKATPRRKNRVDPLQLKTGDYVVHNHHGIGRFVRLEKRTNQTPNGQVVREYIVLEYAGSKRGQGPDQLWVPTDTLDQLSKYSGGEAPVLSKMGGSDWSNAKAKARRAVKDIAKELIALYAARNASKGYAFSPDTPWQRELEDAFEYVETPDQLITVEEVKADMEKPVPMDRLICGDVGYGKTEIAVRAAFKAVQDGKQVAVLAPTTLLVNQHLETFRDRYSGFPVRVEALSRFSSPKETKEVKEALLSGGVEVVIGTHALLTGEVRFKDLGLVIIDEEQRFGVEHKEALKALRMDVDVLAMSATPIPRTLEMAITGIRSMSTLDTPPEERHPVLTYVGGYTDAQVIAAVRQELLRDGQVYFLHNRVEDIAKVAAHLSEILPGVRVRYAHGKMGEKQLESVMLDFWNHEFDVLVCTTIVENGLDITNANTMIIDRADMMGLGQLHQLRGRVGRGRERAYAYFLYPKGKNLSETAHERLKTIATNTQLGSGVAVAQKDLEIRGAGNLLGAQQSGQIAGVGFDLYVRMIAEAVAAYHGQSPAEDEEFSLDLPLDAYVPQDYIPGESLRLEAYTKISKANDEQKLKDVSQELRDRYGPIPPEVSLLFELMELKNLARGAGLKEIKAIGKNIRFSPVTLATSQQLRLKRLHPAARHKLALHELIIPAPVTRKGVVAVPVGGSKLIEWVRSVITNILIPF